MPFSLSSDMEKAVKGISSYQKKTDKKIAFFNAFSRGQKPSLLALFCSDSRVNIHEITQSALGEIFTIQNAGNIITPQGESIASIEYALHNLPITDIIICGHSCCGAMEGLYNESIKATMPYVHQLLLHAQDARRHVEQQHYPYCETSKANVLKQIENLKKHSFVTKQMEENGLNIWGWYYDVASREVLIYDEKSKCFSPSFIILTMHYIIKFLTSYANPQTAQDYLKITHLIQQIQKEGIKDLWPILKEKLPLRDIKRHQEALLKIKPDLFLLKESIMHSIGYNKYCATLIKSSFSIFTRLEKTFDTSHEQQREEDQKQNPMTTIRP